MTPKRLRSARLLGVLAVASSLAACAHKKSEDVPVPLQWDDLTMVKPATFEPSPEVFLEDVVVSEYNLNRLPHALRGDSALAKLVLSRGLQDPSRYNRGVLGRVGSAKMFVTTDNRVRTPTDLYGVMMRVLSEKYGCFLTKRVKTEEAYRFYCRDKRQIVLWHARGDGWVQFYGRQFDAEGYEIKVEDRRIVRISNESILAAY